MRWKSFQTRVSAGINDNTITCSGEIFANDSVSIISEHYC